METEDFESVGRTLRPELVRYAARLVGEADAEDVVQLALAKAAFALSEFRGESSPRTWLYRITTHAAYDWNRSRRAPPPKLDPKDDEATLGSEDAQQERSLLREEMSRCMLEVLRRLPESYQTVLALSDCDELSDREVAEVLGETLGAVKVRLHRARARMKKELENDCSFYRDPDNILCCDRKQESLEEAYPSAPGTRLQVESRESTASNPEPKEDFNMSTVETLPTKQKHLIGVGAAIAAGCEPCTKSFVAAASEAGACERGIRFALESGIAGRISATAAMTTFADEAFAHPELDTSFRQERALIGALIAVSAAIATNSAPLLKARVEAARAVGATDAQLRVAAQLGRTAKRGAEGQTEAAFSALLSDASPMPECGTCGAPNEPPPNNDAGEPPCNCFSGARPTTSARNGACGCGG